MPKEKTKIILVSLLIADLCLVLLFLMLYIYTMNQISETITNTDQVKFEIKKGESLSFMKKDIEDAKNYKGILDSYLIQKNDTVSFIKILENLVASSSLKSQVSSVTYESS